MIVSRRAMLAAVGLLLPGSPGAQTPPPVGAGPGGMLTVTAADLIADPATGLRRVAVAPITAPARRRLASARADGSPAGKRLAEWQRSGAGAGNLGDLYDNRDRGHSRLRPERYPRVTFVRYAEDARAAQMDYGLNDRVLFGAITVGNASLAMKAGWLARSLARAAMTQGQTAMQRVSALYNANHLYVYPEHRDHDPAVGDLFTALSPHWVISQGSSGSDRPFVEALLEALAALQPRTKADLADRGLIAPALQHLLRRTMAGIGSDADYLTAAAHPSAFDRSAIRRMRLIQAAQALVPGAMPAPPRLSVAEEPTPIPGIGVFGNGLTERLFDTPEAIARVAHGVSGERRYRLRAEPDPRGGARRVYWTVLRGPGVSVEPTGADGALVTVPWIEPYAAAPTGLQTARTDIMAVVERDGVFSAPAFFSVSFPPDRRVRFGSAGQPLAVEYRPPENAPYTDPALFPARLWRDRYRYDAAGHLLGWDRDGAGGPRSFTRHGLRVTETDGKGRPALAEAVDYPVRPRRGRAPVVEEVPSGPRFAYDYADAADMLGTPRRVD